MAPIEPAATPDLLGMVPEPFAVHARLCEIEVARRVLRRQLKLSLEARRARGDLAESESGTRAESAVRRD